MLTNKFSIGGLTGVHVSSIGNEVIRTISIFFNQKILNAQKRKSSQNKLQKQKQVKEEK